MLTVLVSSADGVTPLIYRNESFNFSSIVAQLRNGSFSLNESLHRDSPLTAAASNVAAPC